MGLFKRKQQEPQPLLETHLKPETPVEIIAHKDAKKEIVDEAQKVNAHLKELLVKNGFTIKIYLAAQSPAKTQGKGGK